MYVIRILKEKITKLILDLLVSKKSYFLFWYYLEYSKISIIFEYLVSCE